MKQCRTFGAGTEDDKKSVDAPRLMYGRKEAARQISVSVRTLDYLIAAGQLRCKRLGGRVLLLHAELVRFSQGLTDYEQVAA
jgi:excisionase family DNA binding protein